MKKEFSGLRCPTDALFDKIRRIFRKHGSRVTGYFYAFVAVIAPLRPTISFVENVAIRACVNASARNLSMRGRSTHLARFRRRYIKAPLQSRFYNVTNSRDRHHEYLGESVTLSKIDGRSRLSRSNLFRTRDPHRGFFTQSASLLPILRTLKELHTSERLIRLVSETGGSNNIGPPYIDMSVEATRSSR